MRHINILAVFGVREKNDIHVDRGAFPFEANNGDVLNAAYPQNLPALATLILLLGA